MTRPEAIRTLIGAFSALSKEEFGRLREYKEAGREFLCGRWAVRYCLDGKG